MSTVASIAAFLEQLAPACLAEEWDNVGLLVGRRDRAVKKLMTCLTVTPASAAEAVEAGADLIVTHHPLPFNAMKRLTTDTTAGGLLLDLIAAHVAVYSAHTAFDSAADGANQRSAFGLELRGIAPLVPHAEGQGAGRWGWLSEQLSLDELAVRLKRFLKIERLQMVGQGGQSVRTVAVACGAAGEFLDAARERLRRDGAGRGPISHLSGGRGPGHRPAAARPLRQRAVRYGRAGGGFGPPVSRCPSMGQPARDRPSALGLKGDWAACRPKGKRVA